MARPLKKLNMDQITEALNLSGAYNNTKNALVKDRPVEDLHIKHPDMAESPKLDPDVVYVALVRLRSLAPGSEAASYPATFEKPLHYNNKIETVTAFSQDYIEELGKQNGLNVHYVNAAASSTAVCLLCKDLADPVTLNPSTPPETPPEPESLPEAGTVDTTTVGHDSINNPDAGRRPGRPPKNP